MYWDDQPASEQQLVLLRNAGYTVSGPLTRTEAARLIRDSRRNPSQLVPSVVRTALPGPAPSRPEPPASLVPSSGELSESTRMKAYGLRTACEQAKRALAATPGAPNVRADAAASASRREQFWLDTCREVREMQVGSMPVFEMYQRYGCRFFAPTCEQVQVVLDALDNALPTWDRDHPELFYQTLELNFPQLLRRVL